MRYFVAGNFWLFIALLMLLFKENRHMSIRLTEYGGSFPPIIYYGAVSGLVIMGISMIAYGIGSKKL